MVIMIYLNILDDKNKTNNMRSVFNNNIINNSIPTINLSKY